MRSHPRFSTAAMFGAAAVVLALVVRLVALGYPDLVPLDSDEAVTGLMAQHILDGGDFPVFFAGQNYMGALEQYLQAGVLAVAPDNAFTLRIPEAVIAAATAAIVYLVGARVTRNPWGGALAAGLFAVGPWFNIVKGVESHGAYTTGALLAILGVYLALRLDPADRRAPWIAAALGLVAGLALWELWLAAYLIIPAVLWALASARGHFTRLAPPFVIAGLIGAAPFLGHLLSNGFDLSLGSGTPPVTTVSQRADGLFNPIAKMFVGVGQLGTGEPLARWLVPGFVVAIAIAALGVGLWTRRRGLVALVTLRRGPREPVDILLLAFLVAPLIYVASDFTFYTGTPRYLFTLYPAFAVLLAAAALSGSPRWRLPVAVASLAAVAVLSLWNAHDSTKVEAGAFTIVGGGRVFADDVPKAADALRAKGIDSAYADYWLAYPLGFAGEGHLAVSPFTNSRFPDLDADVARDPAPAYVAPTGPAADIVENALRERGITYEKTQVASLTLFTDLSRRADPQSLGLG